MVGLIKGDTRSLDNGSYIRHPVISIALHADRLDSLSFEAPAQVCVFPNKGLGFRV